ncbi:Retrotransposon-derived protein peg10 [Mortierella sp. AD011]|nr:Retrotransposon-derived protein peg10 [Mortierella sp. AD011]
MSSPFTPEQVELLNSVGPRLEILETSVIELKTVLHRIDETISKIVSQGPCIDHLETYLKAKHEFLETLYMRKDVLGTLPARMAGIEAARNNAATAQRQQKGFGTIKISEPDKFSGKREECRTFLSQLDHFIDTHEDQFPNDITKIRWVVTRLTGAPYNYVEPFLKLMKGPAALRPALITNYAMFTDTLQNTFRLKDILAQRKYRDLDFDSLANESIEIDNLQYARALEKKENQRADPVPPQTRRSHATPSNPVPHVSPNPPSKPEPMDLSQVRRLSPEERLRRQRENLCMYCGGDNHFANNVPTNLRKPKKELQTSMKDQP